MNNKAKLLISECLCGVSCRYDGKDNLIEQLPLLKDTFDLVTVCPEVLGGLSTPRDPAERQGKRVCTANGTDVTTEFHKGAQIALHIAMQQGCKQVYFPAFTGSLVNGCSPSKVVRLCKLNRYLPLLKSLVTSYR